jgi:hypothetical protein
MSSRKEPFPGTAKFRGRVSSFRVIRRTSNLYPYFALRRK